MRCIALEHPCESCTLKEYGSRPAAGAPDWTAAFIEGLPNMLTPKQIAETLSISDRSARELCSSGALEGAFKLGSTWRVPKGAIARLMADGGIGCGSIREYRRSAERDAR